MKIHLNPQEVLDAFYVLWEWKKRMETSGTDMDPKWDTLVNKFERFAKQAKKLQSGAKSAP